MPTIFTHALEAYTISRIYNGRNLSLKTSLVAMCCAMLPDADVIAFFFGIPYGSTFGHRGFTHSICFAVLLALAVTILFFRNEIKNGSSLFRIFLLFFLATVSHPVSDMLTNGGLGVALFSPFSNERYFCPWFRPILVSPLGYGFFSEYGLRVLASELFYVGLPCLFALLFNTYLQNKRA